MFINTIKLLILLSKLIINISFETLNIIIDIIEIIQKFKFNKINKKPLITNNHYIVNIVLSRLDFMPSNINIETINNKLFIKCHNYSNTIFDNNDVNELLNYKQSPIYIRGNIGINAHYYNEIIDKIACYSHILFIKINYADIIINLETKTYEIINIKFNIRKPTFDTSNLFRQLINNINNPDYKFKVEYDIKSYSKSYSDIKNNIYDLDKLKIIFTNNKQDIIIYPTNRHINGGENMELNINVDTKPTVSNQIKRTGITGIFIINNLNIS